MRHFPDRRRRRWPRRAVISTLLLVLLVLAALAIHELSTSRLQSRYLSQLVQELTWEMRSGSAPRPLRAPRGPYDLRLGYAQLPEFLEHLAARGYHIERQAQPSPRFLRLRDAGLYNVYPEKTQAGLVVLDDDGATLFQARFPGRVYRRFEDIPPLVVDTLLFIENRELLNDRHPRRNPAIEWDRLGRAVLDRGVQFFDPRQKVVGGSTLATQIEKFRHSRDGYTSSAGDKLRQMGSASLRAYLDGPETARARRRIVLDYLNSVPLAAAPGYGEVNGFGDGLWAWFGTDFDHANRLLGAVKSRAPEAITTEQATAFRQVLSLLIAHRRPSYYLGQGFNGMQTLVDSHLRIMANEGMIGAGVRDATLAAQTSLRKGALPAHETPFAARKTDNIVRTRLAGLLGMQRLYDLDRIDLTARSTIDKDTQQTVTRLLHDLRRREAARAAGLVGFRLLGENDNLERVVYSFTLYERTELGNLLRVQADNFDQPLNINEGVKLDLGSTAKLRALVHYLEIVAEVYGRLAGKSEEALRAEQPDPRDHITRWVIDHLLATPGHTLAATLDAALERRYSAGPGERFFTGGGVHSFVNFNAEDNGKVMNVKEALRDSVNLVFIRLMRDIVYYHMYKPGSIARQLERPDDPQRMQYLARFADQEGQSFIRRFHAKYQDRTPTEIMDLLAQSVRPTPVRLVTLYRSVFPDADLEALKTFLRAQIETLSLSDAAIEKLYEQYSPERYSLPDRGYIAYVHPLEIWVAAYLVQHPESALREVIAASADERQAVYRWLFKTRRKNVQDTRIRSLLEVETFAEIHRAWKRLGYPFESLVPSYATAIGSSADRPAALAELMGILVNDGKRLPIVRFGDLHFAQATPYETVVGVRPPAGEQVLAPEVAAAARAALIGVVREGTARRLGQAFTQADGSVIAVGGKTGTGDHRYDVFGPGGRLLESRVVNRTATFVFMIGDRFFGTLTVYVAGAEAARYGFTSSLPVQVLKTLVPTLMPLITGDQAQEADEAAAKTPAPDTASRPQPSPTSAAPQVPAARCCASGTGGRAATAG